MSSQPELPVSPSAQETAGGEDSDVELESPALLGDAAGADAATGHDPAGSSAANGHPPAKGHHGRTATSGSLGDPDYEVPEGYHGTHVPSPPRPSSGTATGAFGHLRHLCNTPPACLQRNGGRATGAGTCTETQALMALARPVQFDRFGFVVNGSAGPASTSAAIDHDFDEPRALRHVAKWRAMLGPNGSGLYKYAKKHPDKLKSRIRKGIPDQLRGLAWQIMSGGRALMSAPSNSGVYPLLLQAGDVGMEMSILRDLSRTFPTHIFYMNRQGPGQHSLYNVLRAYSAYDRQVGYVQGMGFLAAILLLYMPEEEAFWTLVALMQRSRGAPPPQILPFPLAAIARKARHRGGEGASTLSALAAAAGAGGGSAAAAGPAGAGVAGSNCDSGSGAGGKAAVPLDGALQAMYLPGLPLLQRCLWQFRQLLAARLPALSAHLQHEGVEPAMYATHWFNTAFAYSLPFPYLLRVWDVFMWEGLKVVFRVGVAVLEHAQPRLLAAPFEELADMLGAKRLHMLLPPSPEALIRLACRVKVSGELRASAAAWEQEQKRPPRR